MNLINHIYYQLKPFIPRSLQIALRRMVVQGKRKRYSHIWPIDEKAAKPPENWRGWPDGKKFALVLMHDVDTAKGHEKCLDLAQIDERMGFRSSFNFVPERYLVSSEVRQILVEKGFEIGVHGLKHDGKLFSSRKTFLEQAARINHYLKDWKSVGFVSPSMHRNLDWVHDLNLEYDASTFDTDPFEPQPEGVSTIFPFWVPATRNPLPEFGCSEAGTPARPAGGRNSKPETVLRNGFIELPYTLPQDFTLFVIVGEKSIDLWKQKLDWIVKNGAMALLITHPDYMSFNGKRPASGEYPVEYYKEFLEYIKTTYKDQYWNVLPKEVACFWRDRQSQKRKTILPQKYEVKLIDPITDPRWDAFVENHPYGWICHLSGWKKVLETSFPHMKGHYLALVDESNEIKAGLPLYEVRSWLTGNRLVSIPFATLSDPLISSQDEFEALFNKAIHLSHHLGVSHIHIKTLHASRFIEEPRLSSDCFYVSHYLPLNGNPSEILKTFHLTAVRQPLRKLSATELKVHMGAGDDDLRTFYSLYGRTRKRLGLPSQPYGFFQALWNTFMPNGKLSLLLAELNGRPVAGHIYFKSNGRCSMEFEGWDRDVYHLTPNHFLIWEALKTACGEGYQLFDFGRTSPSDKGLMKFKERWGTELISLSEYYYPGEAGIKPSEKQDSSRYKFVRRLCNVAPDPMYQIISGFCYRHLG